MKSSWFCPQMIPKKKILWATYWNVTYAAWNGDPDSATLKGWQVEALDSPTGVPCSQETPSSVDHHRSLGIGLLEGPTWKGILMSQIPLHTDPDVVLG